MIIGEVTHHITKEQRIELLQACSDSDAIVSKANERFTTIKTHGLIIDVDYCARRITGSGAIVGVSVDIDNDSNAMMPLSASNALDGVLINMAMCYKADVIRRQLGVERVLDKLLPSREQG